MKYNKIEKSLLHPTIQVVAELEVYKQSKSDKEFGYLYTLYRSEDKNILIGYTTELSKLKILYESIGYKLIDKREGKKNELRILKDTLFEIGYKPNNQCGFYYSSNLMYYLNILGWPTGLYKYNKKIKKFI